MSVWQDIRFAFRLLLKDPWFAQAAMTALSLGIAANTAVFTLVNAVLIRGLPMERPERVMFINEQDARGRNFGVAYLDFEDWRAASKTIGSMAAFLTAPV